MDVLREFLSWLLHLEQHLNALLTATGLWAYVVFFLVIFAETGLVVTPFLPGDSLLFALGAIAAGGKLDLMTLLVSLSVAAIVGDSVNYWIGAWLGPRLFRGESVRFLNRKHLEKTHEFYERYGAKTIILARFVPIVRTFAPFVAGMGRMTYARFMTYNVIGGLVWVIGFLWLGFLFGNVEIVKKNFELVVMGIIVVSILPAVYEFWRERRRLAAAQKSP